MVEDGRGCSKMVKGLRGWSMVDDGQGKSFYPNDVHHTPPKRTGIFSVTILSAVTIYRGTQPPGNRLRIFLMLIGRHGNDTVELNPHGYYYTQ